MWERVESVLQYLDSRLTQNRSQILVIAKRFYLRNLKEAYIGIKRKHNAELKGIHDNAGTFMRRNIKTQLMAKVKFFNQVDSFVRKLHFSTSW